MLQVISAACWLAASCLLLSMPDKAIAESMATWLTPALGEKPFLQSIAVVDEPAIDSIVLGRSFFSIPWVAAPASTTARDGLGPLFNANTCETCHQDNGSAVTVTEDGMPLRPLLFKLARPTLHRSPAHSSLPRVGDPVYGQQIAINATGSVRPEAQTELDIESVRFNYPDGQAIDLQKLAPRVTHLSYGPLAEDTVVFLRQPNVLAGLGLIEQVSDAEILTWEDAQDADGDGISGRANRLPSGVLGRYGWKAAEPSLRAQVAIAAASDMGLTNSLYPNEACEPVQSDCRNAPRGRATNAQASDAAHDLPDERLQAITNYVASFKAPHADTLNAQATLGSDTFDTIGCTACHRRELRTADKRVLSPMSDFLLHDMGGQLSEGVREYDAEPSEFRTAPLWGLGARTRAGHRFLHDARARTPEEAILWHGGEADASRNQFVNLDAPLRAALLHYLSQL